MMRFRRPSLPVTIVHAYRENVRGIRCYSRQFILSGLCFSRPGRWRGVPAIPHASYPTLSGSQKFVTVASSRRGPKARDCLPPPYCFFLCIPEHDSPVIWFTRLVPLSNQQRVSRQYQAPSLSALRRALRDADGETVVCVLRSGPSSWREEYCFFSNPTECER